MVVVQHISFSISIWMPINWSALPSGNWTHQNVDFSPNPTMFCYNFLLIRIIHILFMLSFSGIQLHWTSSSLHRWGEGCERPGGRGVAGRCGRKMWSACQGRSKLTWAAWVEHVWHKRKKHIFCMFPCVPVDSFGVKPVKLQSSSFAVIAVKCLQVAQTLEAACCTARADQRQHGGSVRNDWRKTTVNRWGLGDVILRRWSWSGIEHRLFILRFGPFGPRKWPEGLHWEVAEVTFWSMWFGFFKDFPTVFGLQVHFLMVKYNMIFQPPSGQVFRNMREPESWGVWMIYVIPTIHHHGISWSSPQSWVWFWSW